MINCTYIEKNMVAYIDGELDITQINQIDQHLTKCDACKASFEETKVVLATFSKIPLATPSKKVTTSFQEMLAIEKKKETPVIAINTSQSSSYKRVFQLAACMALLITGYLAGGYKESSNSQHAITAMQEQQQQLKKNMLLAMIDNSSASKRIKAVNYTEEFTTTDTKILEALIDRMQHDPNSNVRLSAVEALSKFIDSEMVKTALIETLKTAKNPSIQIEIIQILVQIQEKRALDPMKKLLEQPELPNYVKTQVNIGIAKLI